MKARFHVSLFAGTGVDESNYHYVMPGETIECPLPVPTRDGYAFEGWYDGDRRITEETKVEKRESHTLRRGGGNSDPRIERKWAVRLLAARRVDSAQCRQQLAAAEYDIGHEVDRLAEFYESSKNSDGS